jgi:hypothetical protein
MKSVLWAEKILWNFCENFILIFKQRTVTYF